MTVWKDGLTTQQVAEKMLRNHLIRCHRIIAKDCPEIAGLNPTDAADYLLHLRDSVRIDIQLSSDDGQTIHCTITELNKNN